MTDLIKNQNSPLVRSVLALENHFSELIRLGSKIEDLGMKSDTDFEQAERLMKHFAEHGEGVASEVVQLSQALTESRSRAEAAAQLVSVRAEQLQVRKTEEKRKMEELRLLGEKVRDLTTTLIELKQPEDTTLSNQDRTNLSERLAQFELQLHPLIEEATRLRKEAHLAKMKILEQSADSLSQSLSAVSKRLSQFQPLN